MRSFSISLTVVLTDEMISMIQWGAPYPTLGAVTDAVQSKLSGLRPQLEDRAAASQVAETLHADGLVSLIGDKPAAAAAHDMAYRPPEALVRLMMRQSPFDSPVAARAAFTDGVHHLTGVWIEGRLAEYGVATLEARGQIRALPRGTPAVENLFRLDVG